MKACTRCGKENKSFYKMCDRCRHIGRLQIRKRRETRRDLVSCQSSQYKTCPTCLVTRAIDSFDGFKTCNKCREIVRKAQARYRKTHREVVLRKDREGSRVYRKAHPGCTRAGVHNYRARIKGNGGKHTTKELRELFEQQDGFCYLCGKLLYGTLDGLVSVEHKIPVSRGGSNNISNIGLAHLSCNQRKHTRTHEEFTEIILSLIHI